MLFEFALNRRAFRHKRQAALLAVLRRLVTCQHTKGPEVIKNLVRVAMTLNAARSNKRNCLVFQTKLRYAVFQCGWQKSKLNEYL